MFSGRTRSFSRDKQPAQQQQRLQQHPVPPPLHFDGSMGYSTDANLHAVSLKQIVAHARSVKQGWLHKKGRHFTNWKKRFAKRALPPVRPSHSWRRPCPLSNRWFVLSPESLQYFTSPDMAKAKDEIPLEVTTEVRFVA